MGLKASRSCHVFLFRQFRTRGKAPAKRPRNAPLWGLNLSAQLSLVNLFLCEIFPKPFIPPLSSGNWNAEKIHFFFFQECVFCVLGETGLKRKENNQVCVDIHTHVHTLCHEQACQSPGSSGGHRVLGGSSKPAVGCVSWGCGSSVWDTARETPHYLFPWQHHSFSGLESCWVG